jgi:hypothetical protein
VQALIRSQIEQASGHGANQHTGGRDNITSTTCGGTSPTYALRRLKRDRPELAEPGRPVAHPLPDAGGAALPSAARGAILNKVRIACFARAAVSAACAMPRPACLPAALTLHLRPLPHLRRTYGILPFSL